MGCIVEKTDTFDLFCYEEQKQKELMRCKVTRSISDLFSVILFPITLARFFYKKVYWAIGKLIVTAQLNHDTSEKQAEFLTKHGVKDVVIKTRDGVCLEAMYGQGKNAEQTGPIIIFFNPNSSLIRN